MNDFHEFLNHEKQVLLKNIERMENGLEWYEEDDPLAQGHLAMIDLQRRHVAMIDSLIEDDGNIDSTLATCTEAIALAEENHRQILAQGKSTNEQWWVTLDTIQFLGSLISRIQNFRQHA